MNIFSGNSEGGTMFSQKLSLSRILPRVILFVLLPLLHLFPSQQLKAQKVAAKVTLILKRLPLEKREKLMDFGQKIENYISTYDWTDSQNGGVIKIAIQMYLEDISTSYEDRYRGRILVSNNTDIQYFDKRWRFRYHPTDFLVHDENTFNSLTSLIDYYIYLILGGEFDKYGRFYGTAFYEKAKHITDLAQFGLLQFYEGWDLRKERVLHILSEGNKKFREMVDIYFLGLSYAEEELKLARKYCRQAVQMIEEGLKENPRNDKYKQFLNAHHIEIIDLFDSCDDKSIFEKLIALDPDHEHAYRQHLKK